MLPILFLTAFVAIKADSCLDSSPISSSTGSYETVKGHLVGETYEKGPQTSKKMQPKIFSIFYEILV